MKVEIARDNDKLIAQTTEFKGVKRFEIRTWDFNDQKGYVPTKKAIVIKDIGDLEFLLRALNDNKNEIIDWLTK
jgi:hypothetical protein